ncbi:MAG: hypothetical protein Q8M04_03420 [Pseudomonadota bacterium]|nr:hypothetical protein [Pseudomonadota bacterium]
MSGVTEYVTPQEKRGPNQVKGFHVFATLNAGSVNQTTATG